MSEWVPPDVGLVLSVIIKIIAIPPRDPTERIKIIKVRIPRWIEHVKQPMPPARIPPIHKLLSCGPSETPRFPSMRLGE